MQRLLLKILRGVMHAFRKTECRLKGIKVGSHATVAPATCLQPSGGFISIGSESLIDQGVVIRALGGIVSIGNGCSVGAYSVLIGGGNIIVCNNVRIGPQVCIIANNHVFSRPDVLIKDQPIERLGILIEADVWIGAGAKILDGVSIGHGTVVGAGAVVSRSTHPNSVVMGVPARLRSKRGGI